MTCPLRSGFDFFLIGFSRLLERSRSLAIVVLSFRARLRSCREPEWSVGVLGGAVVLGQNGGSSFCGVAQGSSPPPDWPPRDPPPEPPPVAQGSPPKEPPPWLPPPPEDRPPPPWPPPPPDVRVTLAVA